jgi:predicted alpha/beta-hydrolase family hydrolase
LIASPTKVGRAAPPEAVRRLIASPTKVGRAAPPEAVRRLIARAEHLARAAGPLLFLQGTRDDLADLDLLRPVVAGLGARATLHVIDGADHGFAVRGRAPEHVIDDIAGAIAAWMVAKLDS